MSVSTHLISECIARLEAIRSDADTSNLAIPSSAGRDTERLVANAVLSLSAVLAAAVADAPAQEATTVTEWDKLLSRAQSFASDNGIATELSRQQQ